MWTATVEEDENGDAILVFPPESIAGLGWEAGDAIVWTDLGNGSWSLRKKEDHEGL